MFDANDLIPPEHLILENKIGTADHSKVQAEFAELGDLMAAGLIRQGVSSTSHVLDVGCGLGRVARGLVRHIDEGSYTGIDIVETSVDWCRNAYAHLPNFTFIHSDVYSKFYNPNGKEKAASYRFPFDDNCFDFVFSMSLFTHLLLDGAENYIREIGRVLKPGHVTLNTFFLLDEVSAKLTAKAVRHTVPGGKVQSKKAPEAVVALWRDRVEALHRQSGLEILHVGVGSWSGRPNANAGYQDAIRARKSG